MKTSESISKISAALVTAQKAITFASKDATNPHFRNKYADLPAVIEAIKPALNEAGVMFMQTPSPSEPGTLALTTRLVHESGEWIEDTATLPLPKNDPQGYGSAMTYARRYALAAITGLYQDDDDGNAASNVGAGKTQAAPKAHAEGDPEPDATILAQFNAAKDVQALTKVMNSLPQDQRRLYTGHFNARMQELRKVA
jgi:hypothetical protein